MSEVIEIRVEDISCVEHSTVEFPPLPWGIITLVWIMVLFVGLSVNAVYQILGVFRWTPEHMLEITALGAFIAVDAILFTVGRYLESSEARNRSFFFFATQYIALRIHEVWFVASITVKFLWAASMQASKTSLQGFGMATGFFRSLAK